MEPRVHRSSKGSKLKKLAPVFALKRSAFQIANVGGKQVGNNTKYINSTMKILYKNQVLIHAKRFRKLEKLIEIYNRPAIKLY